jgi:hypothetical protein
MGTKLVMKRYYVDPHNSVFDRDRNEAFIWIDESSQARLKLEGLTLQVGECFGCKDDEFEFNAKVNHYKNGYCYLKADLSWPDENN